ncbi:MAG: endonuclease V [Thermodesulfobacteriota bacterium]
MKIHNLHPWDVSPKEAIRLQEEVLRTRDGVKPVLVSPGHKIDVDTAIRLTLACTTRYRLPETTRLAHLLVTRMRRRLASA